MAMSYAPWADALITSLGQRHPPVQSVPVATSTQSASPWQDWSKLDARTLTQAPVEASPLGLQPGGSPGPPEQRMHWWLAHVGKPGAAQGQPSSTMGAICAWYRAAPSMLMVAPPQKQVGEQRVPAVIPMQSELWLHDVS
jgi:hypothetical protein